MDIVSDEQWSGWFAGLGNGGVILQNAITIVTPWILAGIVIWFVFLISKLGTSLSNASGPEQRKEVKTKMFLAIFGLMIVVIGPTLILIFMNTIFKTVQVKSPEGEGDGTEPPVEEAKIILNSLKNLKNISYPCLIYNLNI